MRQRPESFLKCCILIINWTGILILGSNWYLYNMLDGLWIHDELNFNNYHKNHDRAGAGIGALLVTILTVGYQSIRPATTNPANSPCGQSD